MNSTTVLMVRAYLTEGSGQFKALLKYLHDESKVQGITVFRGITGFGKSGRVHSSTLLDMSLDLPVVIEFFDDPERAQSIIHHLSKVLEPGHVVYWRAEVNTPMTTQQEA
jgi:PII-like signaling protein